MSEMNDTDKKQRSTVNQMIRILEWAIDHGVEIDHVKVGDAEIHLTQLCKKQETADLSSLDLLQVKEELIKTMDGNLERKNRPRSYYDVMRQMKNKSSGDQA